MDHSVVECEDAQCYASWDRMGACFVKHLGMGLDCGFGISMWSRDATRTAPSRSTNSILLYINIYQSLKMYNLTILQEQYHREHDRHGYPKLSLTKTI